MGRLIDCNDVYNAIQITTDNFGVAKNVVEDNMLTMLSKIETVEAIPKADYENRLKADLEAILTELSMEIGEIEDGYVEFDEENKRSLSMIPLESVDRLIQQKIDKLKAESEGKE